MKEKEERERKKTRVKQNSLELAQFQWKSAERCVQTLKRLPQKMAKKRKKIFFVHFDFAGYDDLLVYGCV